MIRLTIRPPVDLVSLNEVADLNGLELQKLVAPRRLKFREVADHEEQVEKPEAEPPSDSARLACRLWRCLLSAESMVTAVSSSRRLE
jgi:hypothetical protein